MFSSKQRQVVSAHHRARQTASGRCTELGGHRELAPRSVAGVNPGDHRTDLDVSCRCTLNTRRHRGCRGRHTHAAAAGRARPDGHGTVRPLPTRCSRGRSPAGDAAVPPPSAAQGPRNTRGYRTRAVPTGAADAEVVPAEGIRRGLWAGCACGMADASVRVTEQRSTPSRSASARSSGPRRLFCSAHTPTARLRRTRTLTCS